MPKFYTHLFNHIAHTRDEEGQDFSDVAAARSAALTAIRGILAEECGRGVWICAAASRSPTTGTPSCSASPSTRRWIFIWTRGGDRTPPQLRARDSISAEEEAVIRNALSAVRTYGADEVIIRRTSA